MKLLKSLKIKSCLHSEFGILSNLDIFCKIIFLSRDAIMMRNKINVVMKMLAVTNVKLGCITSLNSLNKIPSLVGASRSALGTPKSQ